jgi:hypothetical protein
VFLRRYLFVRRVKPPGVTLGCRRDFPGAEYLIAVTNREDEASIVRSSRRILHIGLVSNRCQQFIEPDAMQHLCPHPVDDSECNLGPVLRRIDMDAERTFAEGASTTFTIASATAPTSASSGTMAAKASWIFFSYPL